MLRTDVRTGLGQAEREVTTPDLGNEIMCGKPDAPFHGFILHHTDYTYPHTVEFSCESGYRMKGHRVIRCDIDGRWSATTPKCHMAEPSFPWWAVVICVVVLLPITFYLVLRCHRKHGRNAEYREGHLKPATSHDSLGNGTNPETHKILFAKTSCTSAPSAKPEPPGEEHPTKEPVPGSNSNHGENKQDNLTLPMTEVQNESLILSGLSTSPDCPLDMI